MTFFEHQARARKRSGLLVFLFILAVVGVTLAVNVVVAIFWLTTIGRGIVPFAIDDLGNLLRATPSVPAHVYVWTTLGTLAAILIRSLAAIYSLRAGGDAVARMAGGVPVDRSTRDPDERRLLNVVDEMAIASGVTVPHVFVLPGETAINAFAAGFAPNQAAIAVTEGALRTLTRDELQGVIAHEFSHVLNGDMRLNVTMIGVLAGILFVGEIGEFLMRSTSSRSGSRRSNSRSGIVLAGFALTVIGYIGLFFGRLIKAAVSRQREFLADASSVQFTRNPEGIAGALTVIGGLGAGSLVQNRHAETLSHMFFARGVSVWFESVLATHPSLGERIERIIPRFPAADYLKRRDRTAKADIETAEPERPLARPVTAMPTAAFAPAAAPEPAPGRPRWAAAPSTRAATVVASVGRPAAAHVEYAASLLAALPSVVRDAANGAETAPALVLAFALSADDLGRKQQIAVLERAGRERLARAADVFAGHVRTLAAGLRLPVVAIALATLRTLPPPERDALVRDLTTVVESDAQVTLEEFVLLTIVRQQLAANAGRAEAVKYRSILEIVDDAALVLALLAHAGAGDTDAAYRRGTEKLAMRRTAVKPLAEIAFPAVAASLERLRKLAPFVKRAFLEACVETVSADGRVALAEAELLRAIATTLDCPIPPLLDAVDPTTLA